MELVKAKFFVYHDVRGNENIFISKDIQTLIDKQDAIVSTIKAVVNTEDGEIMFDMDTAYDGEPIILRRFMHYETYKRFYSRNKFIEL